MVSVRHVKINVTEKCFFRCRTCHSWKNGRLGMLGIERYSRLLRQLAFLRSEQSSINLTGGEPLAEKGVYDLIQEASKHGLITHLNTNAYLLDPKAAHKLKHSGLSDISISLDGSYATLHDKIRGHEGSFARVMQGVRYLEVFAKGVKVHLISVISGYNLHDITKIVKRAQDDHRIESIVLNAVSPTLFEDVSAGEFQKSDTWPEDRQAIDNLFKRLLELKRKGYKIANSIGRLEAQHRYFMNPEKKIVAECDIFKDIHINNNGQISHCQLRDDCMIGVIDQDLKAVLDSEKACQARETIRRCDRNCHELLNCGAFDER